MVEAAAGDVCGEVPFRTDPACPLNGKIDVGQIYSTSIISNVQMITIDALCETCGVENVGVLKIDTEGAEPIVIRGAKRMLKEKKIRCILMEFIVEFMEDMNEDPQSLVNHLEQMGFALYGIDATGKLGRLLDPRTVVDERRILPDAPLRPSMRSIS